MRIKIEKGVSFLYCVSVHAHPLHPASLSHFYCFLNSFMVPRHKTGFVLVLQRPYFIVGAPSTAFDLPCVTHRKTCEDTTWKLVKILLCVKTQIVSRRKENVLTDGMMAIVNKGIPRFINIKRIIFKSIFLSFYPLPLLLLRRFHLLLSLYQLIVRKVSKFASRQITYFNARD